MSGSALCYTLSHALTDSRAIPQMQLLHLNMLTLPLLVPSLNPFLNHFNAGMVDIPQSVAMQMHHAIRLHLIQCTRNLRNREKWGNTRKMNMRQSLPLDDARIQMGNRVEQL